jgi:hypothetical protein
MHKTQDKARIFQLCQIVGLDYESIAENENVCPKKIQINYSVLGFTALTDQSAAT